MSQQELLRKVVGVLEASKTPYMVTGSFVSSVQGEPRSSHDIDLIVSLGDEGVEALLIEFPPPAYYLDSASIAAARSSGEKFRQFNLLDVEQGDKVDFWLLSDDPYDQARFARRYVDELDGIHAAISRPEDTILMKLVWSNLSGGSSKQLGDALRVYEVQHSRLDLNYLQNWAKDLQVESLLGELKSQARVL
jgi:hypothetical protein